jgi:histone-lysine N-methyltransferase SETMAR
MEHPPYSPDFAPSDYYLFPKLKGHLRGLRFSSDEYLKEAVEEFFEELSKTFF